MKAGPDFEEACHPSFYMDPPFCRFSNTAEYL
jgi:hypothetical protein